jgi:hypothetical protein
LIGKPCGTEFQASQAIVGEKSAPAQPCSLVVGKEKKQAVGHK